MTYTVQQQGEWAGGDALDLDYEAETLAQAHAIVRDEIPAGIPYLILDENYRVVEEGTR